MLALRTGWTERQIADEISDDFRRACHQALYDEVLAGELSQYRALSEQLDELDITEVPTAERAHVRRAQRVAEVGTAQLEQLIGLREEVPGGP